MLNEKGLQLRNAIAEAGYEVTPDELEVSLIEAEKRIGGGVCRFCGKEGELRHGMCFDCFMRD